MDMFQKLPLKLCLSWRIWPSLDNLYRVFFNILFKKHNCIFK